MLDTQDPQSGMLPKHPDLVSEVPLGTTLDLVESHEPWLSGSSTEEKVAGGMGNVTLLELGAQPPSNPDAGSSSGEESFIPSVLS